MINIYTPAGPSSQVNTVPKAKETIQFCGLFSSRLELLLFVATELRNRYSFAFEHAMTESIEHILVEAIQMGALVADAGVKNAFFFFI